MALFLASIVLGFVPMAVYALIVWRLDRWEKEPFPLLLAAFLWGAVPSVVFALIAQMVFGISPGEDGELSLAGELYMASIVAPVTEELVKGFGVLLIFVFFRREIDSVLDGLIYGSMVGFGFAAVENVFYFAGQSDPGGLFFLFLLRAFVFGMLHALFTGLFGVGMALGKFSAHSVLKIFWPSLGLGLAMLTHSLHNYFVTIGDGHFLLALAGIAVGLTWFAIMVTVCLIHENRWIRIQLAEEVESGVLFAEQALHAADFWARSSLSALTRGFGTVRRKALLHQATELAYQKQKVVRLGSTPERESRIAALRERVRRLSRTDPLVLSGAIRPGRRLPPPLPPKNRLPPPMPGGY